MIEYGTHGLQLKPSGLQQNGKCSRNLRLFFLFEHYFDCPGSRGAISIRIHMDQDPKHCFHESGFKTDLSVLVLALDEDVLEEVVIVVLHLLVRHVGEVRPVSRLQQPDQHDQSCRE